MADYQDLLEMFYTVLLRIIGTETKVMQIYINTIYN